MLITVSSAGRLIKLISYLMYGPYLPIPARISFEVSGSKPIFNSKEHEVNYNKVINEFDLARNSLDIKIHKYFYNIYIFTVHFFN